MQRRRRIVAAICLCATTSTAALAAPRRCEPAKPEDAPSALRRAQIAVAARRSRPRRTPSLQARRRPPRPRGTASSATRRRRRDSSSGARPRAARARRPGRAPSWWRGRDGVAGAPPRCGSRGRGDGAAGRRVPRVRLPSAGAVHTRLGASVRYICYSCARVADAHCGACRLSEFQGAH